MKFGKSKGANAERRRTFKVRIRLQLGTDVIDDLAQGNLSTTFWNFRGEPQHAELYPLHVSQCLQNVEVNLFDSLVGPMVLEGVDVEKIQITPKAEKRADVEFTVRGVAPEGQTRDWGDRFWRMIEEPVELSAKARQAELQLRSGDVAA